EGARLRPGKDARADERRLAHGDQLRVRVAAVHVARTDALGEGRRCTQRHLVRRGVLVRALDGSRPVRRWWNRRDLRDGPERPRATAVDVRDGDTVGPRE